MDQFVGTLILVILISFIIGTVAEFSEQKASVREFSTRQNYLYAFICIAIIALVIWGFVWASSLFTS